MKSADTFDLITMLPLMAAERPQSDIGRPFQLQSEFRPAGDQPQAIEELCQGIAGGERDQVLLGVTGSGKTFTMAHVIERTGRPALILAPNKTLSTTPQCPPGLSNYSIGATTTISSAARSGCEVTRSNCSRRITKIAPGASRCSATRSRRSTRSTR